MGKISKEEYLMLRDEIINFETIINNTINFFYAFISALISFALTREDTIFVLISYMAILPAYLIVIGKREGMIKIGTYLKVYGEGELFNWETRKPLIKNKSFFNKSTSDLPFLFSNIFVFILFLFQLRYVKIYNCYEIIKFIIALILFFSVWYLYRKYRDNTDNYEKEWKKL